MTHAPRSGRELISGAIGGDPYAKLEELRQVAKRRAQATGIAYQMEHLRQVVLSDLKNDYERALAARGESASEAKLDRLARADTRYRVHLKGVAAAKEEEAQAESEYWAMRSELEWDRAALAHLNAMSRLEEPS